MEESFENKLTGVSFSIRNMDNSKTNTLKDDCYNPNDRMKRKRDINDSINLSQKDCHYPNNDNNISTNSNNKEQTSSKNNKSYKQILNYNTRKTYKRKVRLSSSQDSNDVDDNLTKYMNFDYKNVNININDKNNTNLSIGPVTRKNQKLPEVYNKNMNNKTSNLSSPYMIESNMNVKRRCYDRQQQIMNNKVDNKLNMNNNSAKYNNNKSLLCKSKLWDQTSQKCTHEVDKKNVNSQNKYNMKNIETIEIDDSTDSEENNDLPHAPYSLPISKFKSTSSCQKNNFLTTTQVNDDMPTYIIRGSSSDSNFSVKNLSTQPNKKLFSKNVELTAEDKKRHTKERKSSNSSRMANGNVNTNSKDSNAMYCLANEKFRGEMEAITEIYNNSKLKLYLYLLH